MSGPYKKNYEWTDWDDWTKFAKTCGGKGLIKRTRKCIPPSTGEKECPTDTQSEEKVFGERNCSGRCLQE